MGQFALLPSGLGVVLLEEGKPRGLEHWPSYGNSHSGWFLSSPSAHVAFLSIFLKRRHPDTADGSDFVS